MWEFSYSSELPLRKFGSAIEKLAIRISNLYPTSPGIVNNIEHY
jgi:hypothetical protein